MIGDNVYIGPGAVLYGPIAIADNIAIGANSVVNTSFDRAEHHDRGRARAQGPGRGHDPVRAARADPGGPARRRGGGRIRACIADGVSRRDGRGIGAARLRRFCGSPLTRPPDNIATLIGVGP